MKRHFSLNRSSYEASLLMADAGPVGNSLQ
jgi:hypothetical protein